VISWGAARVKSRGGARVTGELAELLEGVEVTEYSARGPDRQEPVEMPSTAEVLRDEAVRLRLVKLGVAFPDFEEMDILMAWPAIDRATRRAWFVLLVLADRRCRNRTSGSSRFNAPTNHLVRVGGFYPGDVAWMAGLRTSEHHRLERVIKNLERFGVLKEQPKVKGKTARYCIGAGHRATAISELLSEEARQDLRRISRVIRECVPSPRSKSGAPDEWEALRRVRPFRTPFVVGTTSPSRRAFLERELPPLLRKLSKLYLPPKGRLRPTKWWLKAHARGAVNGAGKLASFGAEDLATCS